MCIVAPPPRLASASIVFFGQRGDRRRHAQQRGVSRQRLYREADSVVRDLQGPAQRQQVARQHQPLAEAQTRLAQYQAQRSQAAVLTAAVQAELASTARAEGVRLPVARRLLAVFLRDNAPSVATLLSPSTQLDARPTQRSACRSASTACRPASPAEAISTPKTTSRPRSAPRATLPDSFFVELPLATGSHRSSLAPPC